MLMKANTEKIKTSNKFFFVAICFLLLGVAVSTWHISETNQRNEIKENGQRTTAYAISRTEIQFKTPEGNVIAKPLAAPMQGTLKQYDVFEVFYDKEDTSKVVIDQDDTALNLTIWIVAIKMFAGTLAFGYLGLKRRRHNK